MSSIWLDPDRDRPVLQSKPLLQAVFEDVEASHDVLLSTTKRMGAVEKQVQSLTAEMTETDALHDRKGRGVHAVLTGGAEMADSEVEAFRFKDALEVLFPLGRSIVSASYNQQAGTAMQVRKELTAERRQFLERILVAENTSLLDEVNTWLDAGVKVGLLFDERVKLQGDEDDSVSRGDVHAARMEWIRAVNNLISVFDILRLDNTISRRLLANLHETERRAIARRLRASGGSSISEVQLDDAISDNLEGSDSMDDQEVSDSTDLVADQLTPT